MVRRYLMGAVMLTAATVPSPTWADEVHEEPRDVAAEPDGAASESEANEAESDSKGASEPPAPTPSPGPVDAPASEDPEADPDEADPDEANSDEANSDEADPDEATEGGSQDVDGLDVDVADGTTSADQVLAGDSDLPFIRHQAPRRLMEERTAHIQIYVHKKPPGASLVLWVKGEGERKMTATAEPGWFRGEVTAPDGARQVEYAIELHPAEGERRSLFATRGAPYRVLVEENPEIDVVAELDADAEGRRNVFSADFVWGNWGEGATTVLEPSDLGINVPRRVDLPDRFWSTSLGYRHRFHGAVHHLGVRVDGMRAEVPIEGQLGTDAQSRGYNLVRGDLAIRWWRYGLLIIEPALGWYGDEAVGGGEVSMRFGRIYGSGLQVGGGWLEGVGGRFFSRVELGGAGTDVPWLRVGSTFAITDAPDPGRWGLQATGDLRIDPGAGIRLRARAGYQTRMDGAGGPIVGGGVDYAF